MAGVGDNLPATSPLLENVNGPRLKGLVFSVGPDGGDSPMSHCRRVWRAADGIGVIDEPWRIRGVGAVALGGSNGGVDRSRLVLSRRGSHALIIVRQHGLQRRAVTAGGRITPGAVERFEGFLVGIAALSVSGCRCKQDRDCRQNVSHTPS